MVKNDTCTIDKEGNISFKENIPAKVHEINYIETYKGKSFEKTLNLNLVPKFYINTGWNYDSFSADGFEHTLQVFIEGYANPSGTFTLNNNNDFFSISKSGLITISSNVKESNEKYKLNLSYTQDGWNKFDFVVEVKINKFYNFVNKDVTFSHPTQGKIFFNILGNETLESGNYFEEYNSEYFSVNITGLVTIQNNCGIGSVKIPFVFHNQNNIIEQELNINIVSPEYKKIYYSNDGLWVLNVRGNETVPYIEILSELCLDLSQEKDGHIYLNTQDLYKKTTQTTLKFNTDFFFNQNENGNWRKTTDTNEYYFNISNTVLGDFKVYDSSKNLITTLHFNSGGEQ